MKALDTRNRFALYGSPLAPATPHSLRIKGGKAEAASADYARKLRHAQTARVRRLRRAASGGAGGAGDESAQGLLLSLGVLEALGLEDSLRLCGASVDIKPYSTAVTLTAPRTRSAYVGQARARHLAGYIARAPCPAALVGSRPCAGP